VVTNTHEAISSEDKTFMIEVLGTLGLPGAPHREAGLLDVLLHSTEFGLVVLAADRSAKTETHVPQNRNTVSVMYNIASMVHIVYSSCVENLYERRL